MTECPRWRLMAPHYLNVPTLPDGTVVEWEHKETSRENGRAIRKLFPVPMLLNPEDSGDFNYPGEIIVTQPAEGATPLRQDYVFTGAPTRDMEPLNEAAEAISDQHRARWTNPIETLPANGGMNNDERVFMATMMAEFAKNVGAQPQANQSVPKAEFDALKAELESIKALLAKPPAGETSGVRRV